MELNLNLQNPLTSHEEEQYDTVLYLFSNESDHTPCLLSSDLRISIRQTAFSLITQVNSDPFLAYIAVNYVDRFLSKQEILEKKPWIPHILVAASLSLAAKMTNTDLSLSISDLQREEGFEFDALSIQRMETIMLATLQWRMRSITPFSFLRYFLSLLEINDSFSAQSLVERASDIIFHVQHDLKLLEYRTSTIAASALLCAVQDLIPLTFSSTKATICSSEYVNEDLLLECLDVMQETISGTTSLLDRQLTNSRSKGASVSNSEFPERGTIKRRRLNGFCVDTTLQISQTQPC